MVIKKPDFAVDGLEPASSAISFEHFTTAQLKPKLQMVTDNFNKYFNPFFSCSLCIRKFHDCLIVYGKSTRNRQFVNGTNRSAHLFKRVYGRGRVLLMY
jgi:hypothetical protein